eukprot:2130608-Pyramimonas_sp.AAC.1
MLRAVTLKSKSKKGGTPGSNRRTCETVDRKHAKGDRTHASGDKTPKPAAAAPAGLKNSKNFSTDSLTSLKSLKSEKEEFALGENGRVIDVEVKRRIHPLRPRIHPLRP